jgi:hypothetical protein
MIGKSSALVVVYPYAICYFLHFLDDAKGFFNSIDHLLHCPKLASRFGFLALVWKS